MLSNSRCVFRQVARLRTTLPAGVDVSEDNPEAEAAGDHAAAAGGGEHAVDTDVKAAKNETVEGTAQKAPEL